MQIDKPVLCLIGPTAVGKTELSLRIAAHLGCEIVSVDSMQVYRYMDIGTAKVGVEERCRVTHHLIDVVEPDEAYHAARFVKEALRAIAAIHQRGAVPLLVGGTGLYFKALQHGLFSGGDGDKHIRDHLQVRMLEEGREKLFNELFECDPLTARRLHLNDTARIIRALEVFHATGQPLSVHLRKQTEKRNTWEFRAMLMIGLDCSREVLYERINQRTLTMLEQGLEREVRHLISRGFGSELKPMQAIGYRHMMNYILGLWSFGQMSELLARDTRRYAKRQFTWFKKDPEICWFEHTCHEEIINYASQWLKTLPSYRGQ